MSYLLLEYLCPDGHRTESLEERAAPRPALLCTVCGQGADRTISAVKTKTIWASAATMAKSDPPPAPTATNTIALGEGQSQREWRAERRKVWRDHDHKRRRARGPM